MPKVALFNQAGQNIGEVVLADAVFGVEPNQQVIYDVIKSQRGAMRQGTHSTKTRTEVSGGGRKPYRQKGTGNARQGSIRASQWVGGGVAFGPKPRSYDYKVNRKIRRLALRIAYSSKVNESKFVVLDSLTLESFKTKGMVEIFNNLKVEGKIMLLVEGQNEFVEIATRNLPNVQTAVYEHASVYDILNTNFVVLTEATAKKIEEGLLV
ncbi:MAG: 50S ribosomal protein L4 [Candidatus Izemoplasmatales bacterium]|jgi:large subunit ribosomal protein L4|nr:50S ribosomal protein L4 [bacterium]MDZ4197157.1 50S ribosomal protein L4 [Candidatus Izemoplasmatales bacterium]